MTVSLTVPAFTPRALRLGALLVASALAGLLLALAFPPVGASLLAPVAVAIMTLILRNRHPVVAGVMGAVTGFTFFMVLLRWLGLIGADAWIALSVFLALWFALMGIAITYLTRLPWWPLWVAGAWVAQEALRDRIPLGGFPWGRLAFAQTATSLTPWAAIGGAVLVTFATALAGALLAAIYLAARKSQVKSLAALSAALVAVALAGLAIPRPILGETAGGPANTTAAVIQGGVVGSAATDQRRAVLAGHVQVTVDLASEVANGQQPQPDIVIWPENSSDIDPLQDEASATDISSAADTIAAPILVGAVLSLNSDEVANVGIVWNPGTGPGEMYTKQRPVPFGEYVPFRSFLVPIIGRFDQVPRDFIAGDTPGVLSMNDVVIGNVICFEVAYDDVVRDAITGGGRVLVVQTNNATFAGLGQPEQQLAMSRLRAVEFGRSVLVAATTGISAVIAPDGAVVAQLGESQRGALVARIPLRDSPTLAARLGSIPEIAISLAVLGGLIWAGIRTRRNTRPVGSDSEL